MYSIASTSPQSSMTSAPASITPGDEALLRTVEPGPLHAVPQVDAAAHEGGLVGAVALQVGQAHQPVQEPPGPGPRSFAASFLECVRGHEGGGQRPLCGRCSTVGMLAGTGLVAYGVITGEVDAVFVGAGVFAAGLFTSLAVC